MKVGDTVIKQDWGRYGRSYRRGIIRRIGPKTLTLETLDGLWLGDRVPPTDVRRYEPQAWYDIRALESAISELEKQIKTLGEKQRVLWGGLEEGSDG